MKKRKYYFKYNILFLVLVLFSGIAATTQAQTDETQVQGQVQVDQVPLEDQASGLSAYVLGAGDVVRVQVYGEEDLTVETQLSDLGTISYPFLGELQVSGLTVGELQKKITNRLQEGYLLNPDVNITVAQYREFYVNGEVASPGGFPFQPGLTVRKAISLAGGFTDRAAQRKIYILSDSASADTSPARVELSETIKPGDVITVKQRFF